MNSSLWRLSLLQGLFLTNNVAFIAINGLVGLWLAPHPWMATLPVMGYVVGGALCTAPVARVQARWGRRVSFQTGLGMAFGSALLCAAAAQVQSFWLLCAATVLAGWYSANGQLYRFTAAELAPAEAREKAVSLVMAGGLIGAVLGPNLAAATRGLTVLPFVGVYLALAAVAVVAFVLLSTLRFPPAPPHRPGDSRGRPLKEIARQPLFIVAVMASSLGYGVMNLLMAATPLAMQQCGLPFGDAAFVLQWHVIGMFAPGFFTGHLIRRFGALQVMAAGVVLNLACIAVALDGVQLHHFTVALFLLGVGWNFLFTAGTTLALGTYEPAEKDRAQAAINFTVFAVMALSSVSAGALVALPQGWWWLNVASIAPVLLIAGAVAWAWVGASGRPRDPREPAPGRA